MQQLVEITPGDYPTILGRDRRRSRDRTARGSFGIPGLSYGPELWGLPCNDGLSNRPVRRRLVACLSHRLSHHKATIGRHSTARAVITLRGGECDDRCRRCYGGGGE